MEKYDYGAVWSLPDNVKDDKVLAVCKYMLENRLIRPWYSVYRDEWVYEVLLPGKKKYIRIGRIFQRVLDKAGWVLVKYANKEGNPIVRNTIQKYCKKYEISIRTFAKGVKLALAIVHNHVLSSPVYFYWEQRFYYRKKYLEHKKAFELLPSVLSNDDRYVPVPTEIARLFFSRFNNSYKYVKFLQRHSHLILYKVSFVKEAINYIKNVMKEFVLKLPEVPTQSTS